MSYDVIRMRLGVVLLVAASAAGAACGAPPAGSSTPSSAPAEVACAAPSDDARAQVPEADRGFQPIDFDAVPATVGKVVYAAKMVKLTAVRGRSTESVVVATGEAVTLCRAEERKEPPPRAPGPGEVVRTRNFGGPPPPPPPKYAQVVVKTADGHVGDVFIGELSARPLKYDLRHPGDARTLLLNAFREAVALAPKIDALHAKYAYALMGTNANEQDAARRRDYAVAQAMRESFEADSTLVHNLVYGSNVAKESLLREKMWAVRFGDPALVDVYSHGMKDPAEKKKHEPLKTCLGNLSGAIESGNGIRRAEERKAEKPWRKNMTGVPDAQLAALDTENLAKIDDEIAKLKQRRQEQLASPACKEP